MNLALINLAAFSYENVLEPFYPPLKGNSLGDKSFGLSGCRWQHSRAMWLTGAQTPQHIQKYILAHIYIFDINTDTHILQRRTSSFSWGGRHGDPCAEKPCDLTGTEDTLLDPSDQPRQKNLPLCFPKKKKTEKKERGGGLWGVGTEFNYTVETHSLPSGSDISTI